MSRRIANGRWAVVSGNFGPRIASPFGFIVANGAKGVSRASVEELADAANAVRDIAKFYAGWSETILEQVATYGPRETEVSADRPPLTASLARALLNLRRAGVKS